MPAKRETELSPGVWLYSDGSKRYHGHPDKPNGGLAEPMVPGKTITKENASALASKRWNDYELASRRAVGVDRWANIIKARAEVAEDASSPHGNEAARIVGQAVGALGQRSAEQAPAVSLTISAEAVEALRDVVPMLRARMLASHGDGQGQQPTVGDDMIDVEPGG